MAHIEIDGFEIYYELSGPEDAPIVTFANGIFADTSNWTAQVHSLESSFRTLTFDFLGQGKSASATQPIAPSQQAKIFSGLLEALNIQQIHYIGISYGGEVGLIWAITRPKLLKSLILADCVAKIHPQLGSRAEAWLAVMRSGDHDLLYQVSAPDVFSPEYIAQNQPLMGAVRRSYQSLNLPSLLNLLEDYESFDLTQQLYEIEVPTLLLCGEADTLKPPQAMQQIANQIPNSEFIVIPKAGHALHMERPGEFMTCCRGFIEKIEERLKGIK